MFERLTAGIVIVAGLAATAAAQPKDQPARARARLIAEHPALVPGTTAWLGVTFDIDKDWHLYWNGLNDTGFPIKLTPTLPDGYTAGEVLWPAPTRHVTENFLDHVYEHRVTLLLPIQVPAAAAKPGEKVTIKVEAEWLVCKQACLPGDAVMSLTLPVAATAAATGPDATLFAESRAGLPKPLNAASPEVRVTWGEDAVTIASAEQTKGLAFFPGSESAALSDLASQGESKSGTLKLHLEKGAAASRLVGVVEIGPGEHGVRRLFAIDSVRPALNSGEHGASDPKQPKGG